MSGFTRTDIVEIAIQMERNGEAFYRRAAEKMSDATSRDILSRLAKDEIEHGKRFRGMLKDLELEPAVESYPGEYEAYLRAHVQSQVFTSARMEQILGQPSLQPRDALLFAIDSEKDAILYYSEMKRVVQAKVHGVIEAIIHEERGHLTQLVDLMGSFKG